MRTDFWKKTLPPSGGRRERELRAWARLESVWNCEGPAPESRWAGLPGREDR